MHKIDIVFDKVSQIQRTPQMGYVPKQTTFNFIQGCQREYNVVVPGWPEIKPGIMYTCLLKNSNNWQTLVGWKNHETAEIASPVPTSYFYYISIVLFTILISGSTTNFNLKVWIASSLPIQLISVGFVLLGLLGILRSFQLRRLKASFINL